MPRLHALSLQLLLALVLLAPASAFAGGFRQVFSVDGWTYADDLGQLDNDGPNELIMVNQANGTIGVFDSGSGALKFRGSRDIPGWAGVSVSAEQVATTIWWAARDQRQIIIAQPTGSRFVRYDPNVDVGRRTAPSTLRVYSSAPNPFRRSTTLRFDTPQAGDATVRIYDTAGRLVRALDRRLKPGAHSIVWDGLDEQGNRAASGVLFLDVAVGGSKETRKLVRLE